MRQPSADVRFTAMDARRHTLLAPGHEARWAQINEEERRGAVPPADTPVEELLRSGMALSQQAFALLNAIERPDAGRSAPRA
jgi:hypothetical protein